jgi:hypothetical protein
MAHQDKAREQFEQWFGPPGIDYDFERDSSGMYYSRQARRAWEIWEAGWIAALTDATRCG